MFKRKKQSPVMVPEVLKNAVEDHYKAHQHLRIEGYEQCIEDLCQALKGANNFALISIAPAVGALKNKAVRMKLENSAHPSL